MLLIDRYVLNRVLARTFALTSAGLVILLLGRMVGLFDLLASPRGALGHVGEMLLYLAPHLLGMALPQAFFLGILFTVGRLSTDSEIIALMASGWGPHRLLRPVLALSVFLLLVAAVVLGFIAPHARYAYRSLKYIVVQSTLMGSIQAGTFVQAGNFTLRAEQTGSQDSHIWLTNVFIRQDDHDRTTVITARRGWLTQPPGSSRPVLLLQEGEMAGFDAGGQGTGRTTFETYSWPIDVPGLETYRQRGMDQRELTLPELWAARADPPVKPSPPEISAEWNMRLVMILSFPILPLLAISLGLRDPRQNRYYGIVMGLAVVVLYFQAIGFGEALVKRAIFPASVSLWLPFAVLASFAIWHFRRVVSAWPSRRVSGLLPAGANSALRAHGSRT